MRESVGIAMTQSLMRQQDGYVSVNSLPGRGTAVELYFPLVSGSRRE
jgi:hypothetical protein